MVELGFSQEGIKVSKKDLVPEITINADGADWRPLSTDADMQVSERALPLPDVICKVQAELEALRETARANLKPFQ